MRCFLKGKECQLLPIAGTTASPDQIKAMATATAPTTMATTTTSRPPPEQLVTPEEMILVHNKKGRKYGKQIALGLYNGPSCENSQDETATLEFFDKNWC